MTSLVRTKQGKITLEDTNTLSDIRNNNYKIYNIDQVLDIKVIEINESLEQKIRTGQKINNDFNIKDKVIFKNKNNQILGIYENKNDILSVWKNFV